MTMPAIVAWSAADAGSMPIGMSNTAKSRKNLPTIPIMLAYASSSTIATSIPFERYKAVVNRSEQLA
jgi:hypothetical protein